MRLIFKCAKYVLAKPACGSRCHTSALSLQNLGSPQCLGLPGGYGLEVLAADPRAEFRSQGDSLPLLRAGFCVEVFLRLGQFEKPAVTMHSQSPSSRFVAGWPQTWNRDSWPFMLWCMVGAFGAYFCMYGLRKPFTVHAYDGLQAWGMDLKASLIVFQVIGYTLSKMIGIRVISQTSPENRARGILGLTLVAWLALLGFAATPLPGAVLFLFLNGLMLGMVFGLVLGFLEGRRMTECLAAGLCASFILADGVTKSVGAWLILKGVPPMWMPFAAGAVFMIPLGGFVWMLGRIPPPDARDQAERQQRLPMQAEDRRRYLKHHAPVLGLLCLAYLLITLTRSLRGDFATELWRELGETTTPGLFSYSELWVALVIMLGSGLFSLYRDNRRALMHALVACMLGLGLLLGCALALRTGRIGAFPFMVLTGMGLYFPYVLVHTTLFERMMALTRDRGNLGFLMYLADSAGYLGYVALMLVRRLLPFPEQSLAFFVLLITVVGVIGILCFALAQHHFRRILPVKPVLK